jgi:hypothetical protein
MQRILCIAAKEKHENIRHYVRPHEEAEGWEVN